MAGENQLRTYACAIALRAIAEQFMGISHVHPTLAEALLDPVEDVMLQMRSGRLAPHFVSGYNDH